MSSDTGTPKSIVPGLRSIANAMTVPDIFCPGPGGIPLAKDAAFGGAPFPAPAIAKPEGTDEYRDLSHGWCGVFRRTS